MLMCLLHEKRVIKGKFLRGLFLFGSEGVQKAFRRVLGICPNKLTQASMLALLAQLREPQLATFIMSGIRQNG